MLQQTQVERVVTKYAEFIAAFPDFPSLGKASLKDILRVWQGMGYNRRAIALKAAATRVVQNFNGMLPDSADTLAEFSGIGRVTASAICAFAFNRPAVFIETNIRRVFIYFFFKDNYRVKDTDIFPLVGKTLNRRNPREWYYALMDYGVMLKQRFPELNQRSAHYQKQSPFQGSNRQLRGKILRALIEGSATSAAISRMFTLDPEQSRKILMQLGEDGFLIKKGALYSVVR